MPAPPASTVVGVELEEASSRRAGSIVRSWIVAPRWRPGTAPTSPSRRHVSRPPVDVDLADPGDAVEHAAAVAGDPQLDVALPPGQQRRDVLERDEPAAPDDRHPVADPLDLGQDVRREEDRPAGRSQVVEDLVERALHERVEALGRLVEDRQLRVVLERLDDADLLAHPARVVADRPSQRRVVELEPVEQLRSARRRPAGHAPPARRAAARPVSAS